MRILSGIQPSGILHAGNYFGMMKPSIDLQEQGEAFYFIADYHSMTSLTDAKLRREYTQRVAIDFLACGLDPKKAVLFKQSDVPEHVELSWMLSSVCPMGLLERCHSYKDKIAKGVSPNHGLFAYPVLMAADILIYDADVVPVGQDQKQHVEVTRDLANKFNDLYGETFVVPEPRIRRDVAKVPGIDGGKMSKSYNNTIDIFGEEKAIKKRIMSIVMDSRGIDEPKPDAEENNAIQILEHVADEATYTETVEALKAGGFGYGHVKKKLFECYWEHFADARKRREELLANLDYVEEVLREGAQKARGIASVVNRRARVACGLE
ncbi:tryptophan--tRNA ligase [Pelagicoccus sp. SDUM812002]|uniref:tryptophan--tRNA ligase n=1 Tax=Pelagicoccus sp. SDUM812002 TaxID=3041266 RepID=UPI00280E2D07|nr:tryptophan--tRNA ligase [Pelagicoccus sp. SDUM812002]MDQ8187569.1 tryptophan--tRNA ligase [Pelagicoccus sp. SDUM812002]